MQHLYVDYVKMRFFSLGLGTGAALQAFVASVVIMLFAYDPRSGAIHALAASYYAVFRASFLLCFWFLLWGVALFVWRRHGVDARGALGLTRGPTYHAVLTAVFSALLVVCASLALYVLQLIVPGLLPTPPDAWPVVASVAPLALALWPTDAPPLLFLAYPGSRAARYGLFAEVAAVLCSPFSEPTFHRSLVADVLCSMPKVFSDVQYTLCLAAHRGDGAACDAGDPLYRGVKTLLSFLPFWIRLAQSLRALADAARAGGRPSSTRRHALNTLKYVLSLALVCVSTARARRGTAALARAWIALSVASTACNLAWDVHFDWGLFERDPDRGGGGGWWRPRLRLRSHRRYGEAFYWFALASNAVARLGWAVYVSPDQDVVEQHVILLLGVVELLRRFQWVLLRVEWQCARATTREADEAAKPTETAPLNRVP